MHGKRLCFCFVYIFVDSYRKMSSDKRNQRRKQEILQQLLESDSDNSTVESDSDFDEDDVEPGADSDSSGTDDEDPNTSQGGLIGGLFDFTSLQWNDDPSQNTSKKDQREVGNHVGVLLSDWTFAAKLCKPYANVLWKWLDW